MRDGGEGEGQFEITLPECRCRAGADQAPALQAAFVASGLDVRSERESDGRVTLTAGRALRMPVIEMKALRNRIVHSRAQIADEISSKDRQALQKAFASFAYVPMLALRLQLPEWLPVFDVRTFVRTGVDLQVRDDHDASSQLDLLAPALGVERESITIKPRPGWQGYGHPSLG